MMKNRNTTIFDLTLFSLGTILGSLFIISCQSEVRESLADRINLYNRLLKEVNFCEADTDCRSATLACSCQPFAYHKDANPTDLKILQQGYAEENGVSCQACSNKAPTNLSCVSQRCEFTDEEDSP